MFELVHGRSSRRGIVNYRDIKKESALWLALFPAGSEDYLSALFTDPRHGRYCGRYVPGALDLLARLMYAISLDTR